LTLSRLGGVVLIDAGVTVSSPEETTFFTRKDPFSLLNREPNVEVEPLLLRFVNGNASKLVVVETSLGVEISLGSTRLRIDPE
jgi:hypothetical protein